ncbi:MAG TPA: lysophospholipase [Polyangiaceae bacterium]|nr:lysophospholipase [Polyangiaceae bacterium]
MAAAVALSEALFDAPEAVTLEHGESGISGAGGLALYHQWWRPYGRGRAAVVVVHGLKDHSARYGAFAEKLVAARFAVHAFDLRGHARSAGARAWVGSFDEYVGDLDAVVRRVLARERDPLLFLFGHGLGGTIATTWAIQRPRLCSGLVLSGALLQPKDVPAEARGTRLLAKLAPWTRTFQIDVRRTSRDRGTVEDALRDCLVQQGPAPARTARELLDAMGRIDARAAQLTTPLLAMHGSADAVESPEGSKRIVARAGSLDKQLYLYDGLAHDLLHEPERARVLRDVSAWLDERAPS